MSSIYSPIYLDACSTTPPLDKVIKEMSIIDRNHWSNCSSLHKEGIKAADILESNRLSISNIFHVQPDQVVFTSGATESTYLALTRFANGVRPGRIVISNVEHPSVISAALSLHNIGWEIVYWPVDKYGRIDLTQIDKLLEPPTKIVSLIWGQSEVGTIQPINIVGLECQKRGIYFHTDATQVVSQGLFSFRHLSANALSLSAHKFRGPKGIGLLIIDEGIINKFQLQSISRSHENGIRAGTQAVSLIHGMSIALQNITDYLEISNSQTIFPLTYTSSLTKQLLKSLLKVEGLNLTGHPHDRLPNHISFTVTSKNQQPISGHKLVRELSNIGIYVSSGSACSSISNESNILKKIGIEENLLSSGLRLSLGNWITNLNISELTSQIEMIINNMEISN